jgi:hypothetical protein
VAGGETSPWDKPSCDISPRGDIPSIHEFPKREITDMTKINMTYVRDTSSDSTKRFKRKGNGLYPLVTLELKTQQELILRVFSSSLIQKYTWIKIHHKLKLP